MYKLGLGDNNASLEDDYIEWKSEVWESLAEYRREHPLEEVSHEEIVEQVAETSAELIARYNRKYLGSVIPELANFRFYICSQ